MKEPSSLIGKSDLTSREMRKVVMQTEETYSTIETTEIIVKIINNIYAKTDLKQVTNNATQLNAEETTQLLRLLENFEAFFNGTLGYWYTDPVDLELKPDSKPFNSKYYLFTRINKETFCKELKGLVKIGVLTPVL